MASSDGLTSMFLVAERALKSADSSALLVLPRILRRVIKQDRELPGFDFRVPHRKVYFIASHRLLRHVALDELGLEPAAVLPERVILISRPDEDELDGMTLAQLLRHCWRLLFHARVHLALDARIASGHLTLAQVRSRIDHIGQAEFDEIRSVLKQESYVLPPANAHSLYVEFVAVYLEMRYFAPPWLGSYFPSVVDFERIDSLISQDLDAEALLQATRLEGSSLDSTSEADETEEAAIDLSLSQQLPPVRGSRSEKPYWRLIRKAKSMSARGNMVRAAMLRLRAFPLAPPDLVRGTQLGIEEEIEKLARRLQAALGFDDQETAAWRDAMSGLLLHSIGGFWNADARLLYDLQKVCVDHEREIYVVDLLEWVRSFGRRPIKRALPNQREVLMSKHLHSAAGRLTAARLSGFERERLSKLLRAAARSAAEQLRARLRPLVNQALADVGLKPVNVPERVALQKLVEELLDGIVQRGYLTMGNLRDGISRNNLKLADLSGVGEFLRGDPLLRADRWLGQVLDGVYQRGEFYLRWLQRISSLAFGTPFGRFLTQYVVLPFGGAFVALEGLGHLVNAITHRLFDFKIHVLNAASLSGLGLFLLLLIHVHWFRQGLAAFFRGMYRTIRAVFVDVPLLLMRLPIVRAIMRSFVATFLRRYVLNPLVLTGLAWLIINLFDVEPQVSSGEIIALFFAINLVINSRMGRTLEELTADWVGQTWIHIRMRIFVAIFEMVMGTFKSILETIERILYAVDEWLRFKSGESYVTFVFKAILGVVWSVVTFVIRIYVNLLIEPQINPIKHFPVVTVSHKIILPFSLTLTRLMAAPLIPVLGTVAANALAGSTVFLLPGVFGFLVWELKGNWRLYAANRKPQLHEVLVGEHGETLIELMKPGFHSGTLPKLYGKIRRAIRKTHGEIAIKTKFEVKLHHLTTSVRDFIDREFLMLLAESRTWRRSPPHVGRIELASNSVRIELCCPALSDGSVWLAFQEQSGWLIAGFLNTGWLAQLDAEQFETLSIALAGLYHLGGVELVREQLEACLEPHRSPYDVTEDCLAVWPGTRYDVELIYDLRQKPLIAPRPRATAKLLGFVPLSVDDVLFEHSSISWSAWVDIWEREQRGESLAGFFVRPIQLLPTPHRVPMTAD